TRVRHPNLVEVYEPSLDGATLFLPMELLQGATLCEHSRAAPLPEAAVVEWLAAAADGVQALHDAGIIHRDLKPLNIFMTEGPGRYVPKVIDLGVAREEAESVLTQTGVVVGSPRYMAPEQAAGRKNIDGRVDQFALGVIAYELLTGRRRYLEDDTGNTLSKLLRGEPFPAPRELRPSLNLALDQVVMRAMSYDRDDRFASVRDFASALRASLDERTLPPPGVVGQTPVFAPPPAPVRAPRTRGLAAAGAGLFLIVLVAFLVSRASQTTNERVLEETPAAATLPAPTRTDPKLDRVVAPEAPAALPALPSAPEEPSVEVATPAAPRPAAYGSRPAPVGRRPLVGGPLGRPNEDPSPANGGSNPVPHVFMDESECPEEEGQPCIGL
ncbi:MAG: serine/threonine protein kinase, partial [Sandaracinaceae bacterium]